MFLKEEAMNEVLKATLTGLGLNDEQVEKLANEGVSEPADMALLSRDDVKSVTGCSLIAAAKIVVAFAPAPAAATPATEAVDPNAEIPEGGRPSAAQVNSFANSLGIDPSMLSMMMFAGMAGGSGMGGMDISGMIPVAQIVEGYSPKIRNMFFMVMGSLEERLDTPIVVIDEDGSVNKLLTVEYVNGLEEGREPAPDNVYFDGAGTPHEVIRVGVDAQSIYDADPCDSTRPLQKNGMGIGRINWKDVPLEVRQVAFYAVKTGEINPKDDGNMAWMRDHIKPASRRLVFQGQAPKAIRDYNEAARTGTLPTLRVMLTRSARRPEFMPRRRSGAPRDLSGIGREGAL